MIGDFGLRIIRYLQKFLNMLEIWRDLSKEYCFT